jgi:hypothetical protein
VENFKGVLYLVERRSATGGFSVLGPEGGSSFFSGGPEEAVGVVMRPSISATTMNPRCHWHRFILNGSGRLLHHLFFITR